jgi:hypothetical protein
MSFKEDNFLFEELNHNDEKYKNLKKELKKDINCTCIIPQELDSKQKVISIIDIKNDFVASFLWFEGYSTNKIIPNQNVKCIHINFSYTFEKYRNKKLNKKLRLWLESYTLVNKINYIISVPLPDSNSEIILKKLGYKKKDTYYFKQIF